MSLLKSIYQHSPWAIFLSSSQVERSDIWYFAVKYIQRFWATSIIPARRPFFFLNPIILQQVERMYLSFTEGMLMSLCSNSYDIHSKKCILIWHKCQHWLFFPVIHFFFCSLPSHSTGVRQDWWGFFPACHWHSITGLLCPQQAGSWLWLCFLLYRYNLFRQNSHFLLRRATPGLFSHFHYLFPMHYFWRTQ